MRGYLVLIIFMIFVAALCAPALAGGGPPDPYAPSGPVSNYGPGSDEDPWDNIQKSTIYKGPQDSGLNTYVLWFFGAFVFEIDNHINISLVKLDRPQKGTDAEREPVRFGSILK